MATLYEIDQAIKEFEFEIDEETGEILNVEALDELQMEYADKVNNVCLFIKNLRADETAYDNEMKVFKDKKDRAKRKADKLEEYVKNILGGEKFKSEQVEVTYRKSTKVEVVDQGEIPTDYLRVKTTIEPDKTAIKAALKAGEEITGAQLVETQSMTIK